MNGSRIAALAVALFALAGCSNHAVEPSTITPHTDTATAGATAAGTNGDGAAPTVTVTEQRSTPAVGGKESGGSPTPASASEYRVPVGGIYFHTPSRNISCGLGGSAPGGAGVVGCQVYQTSVVPPGADCSNATMPVTRLSKGYYSEDGGPFVPSCFNQGLFNMSEQQKVLPYGRSLTAGSMTCVSETVGVTCTRGEHGFFVSVQSFRQW